MDSRKCQAEGEKALDVLDGVLQNLRIVEEEVLHKEKNLDQTLLVGCKFRRVDDGGHRHHERRSPAIACEWTFARRTLR